MNFKHRYGTPTKFLISKQIRGANAEAESWGRDETAKTASMFFTSLTLIVLFLFTETLGLSLLATVFQLSMNLSWVELSLEVSRGKTTPPKSW